MSSNFVVIGAGAIGAWLIDELLKYKASGAVNSLKVLSRSVSPPDAPSAQGATGKFCVRRLSY